jgi:hypothetical protein
MSCIFMVINGGLALVLELICSWLNREMRLGAGLGSGRTFGGTNVVTQAGRLVEHNTAACSIN